MTDELKRLRGAARAETDPVEAGPIAADAEVDELLTAYFRGASASNAFAAALDAIAAGSAWPDAPSGKAAAIARAARPGTPATVSGALGVPLTRGREAIVRSLALGPDAADSLLDRPAAALLRYEPDAVRRLSEFCGRSPGGLFAAIAASSRASGDFVYAYRPAAAADTPARRLEEPMAGDALLEWGYRFFAIEPPGHP